MPLYEYQCDECGHRFEQIQKYSDALITVCPECNGRVRKLLSSPAIQFKGTGWYITDYARKPSAGQGADSSKTETKSGESSGGETKTSDSSSTKSSDKTASK